MSCIAEFHRSLPPIDRARHRPFGADQHRFLLRPPVPGAEVEAFEAAIHARLPDDYRHFLLAIGNGGAGPGSGLLPLGVQCEDNPPAQAWREWDPWIVERLWEPFQSRWQEVPYTGRDPVVGPGPWSVQELRERIQEVCPPGALAVSHRGCAEYDYLILNGPHRGEIWIDALTPSPTPSFDDWYSAWLEETVAALRAIPGGADWHVEDWR